MVQNIQFLCFKKQRVELQLFFIPKILLTYLPTFSVSMKLSSSHHIIIGVKKQKDTGIST